MKDFKISQLFKSRAALAAVLVAGAAAAFLLSYFIFIVPHGTIAKGVEVGGVKLGGMTQNDAEVAVIAQGVPGAVTVYTSYGAEKSILSADFDLSVDSKKTAEYAYSIGRSGNFLENMRTLLGALVSTKKLNPKYTFDTEKLGGILYDFASGEIGAQEQYSFEFAEGGVLVSRGTAGQSRDMSAEINEVIAAIEKGGERVLVEPKKTEPPMPDSESLAAALYVAPVDARYEIAGGKVSFFAETMGRSADKTEIDAKIEELKAGGNIQLSLIELAPEVTLSSLYARLFNHKLGGYSTTYSASNRSRSNNVELAAAKINGIVLAPGEEFSYNAAVGRRSAENGFLPADVYANGETVQGLGGGVCQVSSTLYCAVLYADLKTTKRQNHSMTVGYVPKGQDATVSYGTIDYRFENNTQNPIKISALAKGGKLDVAIYGTAPEVEKTVKITNNVVGVTEPTMKESQDASLLEGNRRVISKGKTGYAVESVRTVYENGALVRSEKLGKSVYKMVPGEVAIGTKAPMPTNEPTPIPAPILTEGEAEQ